MPQDLTPSGLPGSRQTGPTRVVTQRCPGTRLADPLRLSFSPPTLPPR